MSTYTPGPWHNLDPCPSSQVRDECSLLIFADTTHIATASKELVSLDEAACNARLMAAAPELLKACREMHLYLSQVKPLLGDEAVDQLFAEVDPVIQKAIGGLSP